MARVVGDCSPLAVIGALIRELAPSVSGDQWELMQDELVVDAPYVVSGSGALLVQPSAYLRRRSKGTLHEISLRPLARNSALAFAHDLCYFLNTCKEASPAVLLLQAERHQLLTRYATHLHNPQSGFAASTIERRLLVAKEYIDFLRLEADGPSLQIDNVVRDTVQLEGKEAIKYFATKVTLGARRRSPTLIHILPPRLLLSFLDGFEDPMHSAAAKVIYATGLRRSEVGNMTAKQIAEMRVICPGGPAMLRVVGKGNKERAIEVEPPCQQLLLGLLTHKERLKRLKNAPRSVTENPAQTPLFLNRFGSQLSGAAIGEAFQVASARSGIKRTPHELRHEFAVAYLLNTYRGIERSFEEKGLERWLSRLMIDQTDLVTTKLSRLLGHASVETTRRTYLVALLQCEPSVREAWCEHLESLEIAELDA